MRQVFNKNVAGVCKRGLHAIEAMRGSSRKRQTGA
jgi:hypothetical protein